MKKHYYGLALLVVLMALVAGAFLTTRHSTAARAVNCIHNVDGFGDTAAVVDPVGTFSGALDAAPCDFGIYVSAGHTAVILNADIFGARFSDVTVDGTATVAHSHLHASEMGVEFGDAHAGHGFAYQNTIEYVDNGCGIGVFNVGTTATVTGNVVTAPSDSVAFPEGIDVFNAASVTISNNTFVHNVAGILLEPPSAVGYSVTDNLLQDNKFGIEIDRGTGNVISTNRVENGSSIGILDDGGTNDQITRNFICGYPILAFNVTAATCP